MSEESTQPPSTAGAESGSARSSEPAARGAAARSAGASSVTAAEPSHEQPAGAAPGSARTGQDSELADVAQQLAAVDRLIHEPSRLIIVAILSAVVEADFLYLVRATGLTAGNLSSHLGRLEESGYVAIEKGFVGRLPHTTCRLTDAGRAAFDRYRGRMARALASGA